MRFGLREALFMLVLLATPVAAMLLVFQPRSQEIEVAEREIAEKQSKLKDYEVVTASYDNLGDEVRRIESSLREVERKLPSTVREASAYGDWAEIAARHRLKMPDLDTDKIVRHALWSERPMRMQVRGDFDNFYSFLLDVGRMERIIQIPNMKLERVKGDDVDGAMQAEFTLSIFFEGAASDGATR
ncbi:MAG: type 4a pilus biogenesis protein PilO [Planctomycetota bacterium]